MVPVVPKKDSGLPVAMLATFGLIPSLLLCLLPSSALAQRTLHWDRLDVAARLNADGTLTVTEIQTMVFTGEWNGGERRFRLEPRQQFLLLGIDREVGGAWRELRQDSSLDDVDEYAMTDAQTLRWRSRRPEDPPFAATPLRYRIVYALSGILQKEDDTYRLANDFVFRERDGPIERFELTLALDPVWQPAEPVPAVYTAGPLAPGKSFVVTLPLRFSGEGAPAARDMTRPRAIVAGVTVLLGVTLIAVVGMLLREQRYGRFAPLANRVDDAWIRENILRYPAEVVAAVWDENIGTAEVVALLARMEAEDKLESSVGKGKINASMTLRLKADRSKLTGHERALIDKLFFGTRAETSTSAVRTHYKNTGFNPADEIRPALAAAVDALLPPAPTRRRFSPISVALLTIGAALIIYMWAQGSPAALALWFPAIVLAGVGWVAGLKFRSYLHWGPRAAALCLLPALAIALGAASYLWFHAGGGHIELPPFTVYGLVAVTLACILSCVNAMKSRRSPAAIAFRKRLTSGRAYFMQQLQSATPALRDEWYPWLLGLELSKHVDAWTTQTAGRESSSGSRGVIVGSSSGASGSSSFSGFGGGRSGGAGASASWYTAASGMAATVSPPSSGGSGSGGSSGGGSSGGGSSGGGGGGGW